MNDSSYASTSWAEGPSPFDSSNYRCTLAGVDDEGLRVYCVSIDTSHYDLRLWCFYRLLDRWQLLCQYANDSLSPGHHYCTFAACRFSNSTSQRVAMFTETSDSTSCLVIFLLNESGNEASFAESYIDTRYWLENSHISSIQFDNTTGPQLVEYRGDLYVGGSILTDFSNTFQVFRLLFDPSEDYLHYEHIHSFNLTSDVITSATVGRMIVCMDRLMLVDPEKLRYLDIYRNKKTVGEIKVAPNSMNTLTFFMLDCCITGNQEPDDPAKCCSSPSSKRKLHSSTFVVSHSTEIWLTHSFGWSKLCYDSLSRCYFWEDIDTLKQLSSPVEILDCCKKCLGSKNGCLFWMDREKLMAYKMCKVDSLQVLCVQSLLMCFPNLKCDNGGLNLEEETILFSYVNKRIWERFVPPKVQTPVRNTSLIYLD